jgi:hypothetical protein
MAVPAGAWVPRVRSAPRRPVSADRQVGPWQAAPPAAAHHPEAGCRVETAGERSADRDPPEQPEVPRLASVPQVAQQRGLVARLALPEAERLRPPGAACVVPPARLWEAR